MVVFFEFAIKCFTIEISFGYFYNALEVAELSDLFAY